MLITAEYGTGCMLNVRCCCATHEKVDNDVVRCQWKLTNSKTGYAISRTGGWENGERHDGLLNVGCCRATHEKNRRLARFDW